MKTFLRIILTLVLLAILFSQIEIDSVAAVLDQANPIWLIAGALITLLTALCAAWRWQVILAGSGLKLPFLHVLRLTLTGSFFSMFLPSSVGGDVTKMVLLASDAQRRELAVSSVLLDRVIGMAVTIVLGIGAVALLPSIWGNQAVLLTMGIALLIFCVGAAALFNARLIRLLAWLTPKFIWRRGGDLIERIHNAVLLVGAQPRVLLAAAGISLLRQVITCVAMFCAGIAFQVPSALVVYFAVIPISLAITVLPISINGLGLQDNALMMLFGAAGVGAAYAVSLSIYLHALRIMISLIGGLVFAFTQRQTAPQSTNDESVQAVLPRSDSVSTVSK